MTYLGFAGKLYRDAERVVQPELIARMMRAADSPESAAGITCRNPVGLGVTRLSASGNPQKEMPFLSADSSMIIAFNGDLTNLAELTRELEQAGHACRSGSDSEAVLRGYEKWGAGVLGRLRGVFSFAIYEFSTRTLFLAHDRIGVKPLFYAILKRGTQDETIVFANELKCLLADPAFERTVDRMALGHYLSFQYVPHPWSIFECARKLQPGSWMTYRDGEMHTERYWELRYEPKRTITEEQAVEETFAVIDESVRVHLPASGPVGCFLSGGVDSSTMVAMIRQHVPGDFHTFSIGFKEEQFNELPYARQVAEKFGTIHNEFVVEHDAVGTLGELAWMFEEPYADMSAIPTLQVSKLARQYVPVALNGDGGDESFLGYERYRGFRAFNRYSRIPRVLRACADGPFSLAAGLLPRSAWLELLAYVNHVSLAPKEKLYAQTMIIFREYQKRALLAPELRPVLDLPGADTESITTGLLNRYPERADAERMPYSDIMSYLPGALTPKVERTTTSCGLIARAPMLDHRVMEFAASLPVEIKRSDTQLKRLLKTMALRYFTDEFLNRPKTGFGCPVGEWFRGQLQPFIRQFLLEGPAAQRGFFDLAYLRRMLDQHVAGSQNHHHRIWALITLEAWCQTFLDRQDPLSGPIRLK